MSFKDPKPTKCFMISVMHNGTTFLLDLVRPEGGFFHVHAIDRKRMMAQLDVTETIICPLRHPSRVWESFVLRGKNMPTFLESYRQLEYLDLKYHIHYVPVDLPKERDIQLLAIAKRLGRGFVTDWKPKGQFDGPRPAFIHGPNLSYIFLYPFISRFYNEEA